MHGMDARGPLDLLLSSLRILGDAPVFLVDPPAGGAKALVESLSAACPLAGIHCRDRRSYDFYAELRPTLTRSGPWVISALEAETVVAFLPKGRELLDLTLGNVADIRYRSATEGRPAPRRLLLVGHKREGIGSAGKSARRWFAAASTVASGSHSSLVEVIIDEGRECDLTGWERQWRHADQSGDITVASYPGVFSHGRSDEGTALLLRSLDLRDPKAVLDLGCGSGIIGAVLARRHPGSEVHLVDSGELAVAAARRTIELNTLTADCSPSDLFGEIPAEVRFDAIVTNPPFHSGVATEYATTETLIREAPGRLRRDGELWLVGNRFLPYRELLQRAFPAVAVAADNGRFTVYRALN